MKRMNEEAEKSKRLRKENEKLREVLIPFANCALQIDDSESDDEWARFRLTIGEYRKTQIALAEAEDGKSGGFNYNPLETAPRDATILRLLVKGGNAPLQDIDQETLWETIGFNSFDHNEESDWKVAGWNWRQGCFDSCVAHEVIGWLPFETIKKREGDD